MDVTGPSVVAAFRGADWLCPECLAPMDTLDVEELPWALRTFRPGATSWSMPPTSTPGKAPKEGEARIEAEVTDEP